MSIEICDTIKYYCQSKNNTEAIDLFFEKSIQPQNNFEDLEKYAKARLYLNKLQYDFWKFRYDLWQSVWGELLRDFKNIIGFSDYEDYQWNFYADYKINNKKYRFAICAFDGEDAELYIQASRLEEKNKNDNTEYAIIGEIENDLLENKEYTDCSEWYTRSQYSVSIKNSCEVTDNDIQKFREAATELLKYIG